MADGTLRFDVEIENDKAQKKLQELDQEAKKAGSSLDDSLRNQADKFTNDWNRASANYESKMKDLATVTQSLADAQEALSVSKSLGESGEIINKIQQEINGLTSEQSKLTEQSTRYAIQMDRIGVRASTLTDKIRESTGSTQQQRTIFQSIKDTISTGATGLMNWVKNLGSSNTNASKLNTTAKNVGKSFQGGLKSVIRLGSSMLGLYGVVGAVRKITSEWYQSNNVGALQAQANIKAMTSGIVNLLSPALTFVTNVMGTLFGYINAVSKAFFGVDLLAKSTSKNIGTGVGNAKKLKKEIQGFTASFDEADVASSNIADNLDSGGGSGGTVDLEPNIKTPDLSKFKKQLEEVFKPFLDTMKSIDFEPLNKAFSKLATSAIGSLKVIGDSFTRVVNNSVAPFIKLMVEDIVPKGLETVARILDRLNPVMENLLKNVVEPLINWFLLSFVPTGLQLVFSVVESLSGVMTVLIASFETFWSSSIGRAIAFVAGELILAIMKDLTSIFDEIVESIDFFFTKLEEGDPVAQTIAWSLGLIVTALLGWAAAMVAINVATALFNSISPFGWIVIAVTAVIAIILVLYKNWENIVKFFEETIANISKWIGDTWQGIKDSFNEMVKGLKTWWNELIEALKTGWNRFLENGKIAINNILGFFGGMKDKVVGYFQFIGTFWGNIIRGMFDGVKNIIENIKGIFNGLITFISGVFTGNWRKAWDGIVSVFRNIVGGIANIFKLPINAMIDGINTFIRGINKIKIPSWVPFVGGNGFSIGTIPRLANGGVLTTQTTATMAEYPNARTNPEIVTPQKIMRETLAEALAMNGMQGGNGMPQELTIVTPLILDGNKVAEVTNKINLRDMLMNNGGMAWDF